MKQILVCFALIMSINCMAQTFRVAPRVGLNFQNLNGDITGDGGDDFETGYVGFHFGIAGNLALTDKISVEPAILYSTQGGEYIRVGFLDDWTGGSWKLNYLNVPILAQYEVVDRVTIEAGPQVGFLLSANDERIGDLSIDLTEELNTIDFSAVLGVGYTYDDRIKLAISYSLGLTDVVFDELSFRNEGGFGDSSTWKNNVLRVSFSYYFDL